MAGTIHITGANGSLAIPAIHHLLDHYPDHTALLTVRDASDADVHTQKLRSILAQYPNATAIVRELNLASLSAVHNFTSATAKDIVDGRLPPLTGIVCNAYYWNLIRDAELTGDGHEKTFQVSHLAHVALVGGLLAQFWTGRRSSRTLLLRCALAWQEQP